MKRERKDFSSTRASLIDLTLFLHGICCDIDVETGPRQLLSRYLRKRLELIEGRSRLPRTRCFGRHRGRRGGCRGEKTGDANGVIKLLDFLTAVGRWFARTAP
jgi:hypothetical protein